jgi:hypothetical protein
MTWRLVVVNGRMRVLPRALGFNVGPLSLKVVLADLESCVTFIQNDTNIHTVTLDCFQDIIDRKNTFASPTLLDLSHAHISLLVLNPASSLH